MTPEQYQETVLSVTQELREVRDSWLATNSPSEVEALALKIAELEDKHLAATVRYHSMKVRQLPASYLEAAELKEEISELLIELRYLV